MAAAFQNQVFFGHASASPLGRLGESSHVRNAAGVSIPPWRVYGRYALVYLYDGAGFYADNTGARQALGPGDLIVVRPDLPHAYGATPEDEWREYYLSFDGPVFDLWARAGLLLDAARPVYHLEPVDEWLRRFTGVFAASVTPGNPDAATSLREVCRLQTLLADILRENRTDRLALPADQRWVAQARALLEGGLASLEEIARRLRVTPEGFRKRFTRLAGQSPARYRTARRIDRACELLSGPDRPTIKEVAARTGFDDEFHFSRRFKAMTGESPNRFRQRLAAPP